MNNQALRFILLTVLCFRGLIAFSQVNDAGLWMSVNLEKKINPSISVHFAEEIRLYENITEVGQVFSEAGVAYRFLKKFRASATYRLIRQKRLDDSYETHHRWYADLSYRQKLKPFVLLFRLRYYAHYSDEFLEETGIPGRDHLTVKVTAKYPVGRKWEPYISAEPFFRLNHIVYGSFDQLRLRAGIAYSFNRNHSVDLFYSFTKEFNVKSPETDYVVGIGYNFVF